MGGRIQQFVIFVVLLFSFASTCMGDILLDFDEFTNGTRLTDQYQSLGVLFTGGNEFAVTEPGQVVSEPNYLMNPNAGQLIRMEFLFEVRRVEMIASSVGHAGVVIRAYDAFDNVVAAYDAVFPERGTAFGYFDPVVLETTGAPIRSVETSQMHSSHTDLHGFDNVRIFAVPEPSSFCVLFSIFLLIGQRRRRS